MQKPPDPRLKTPPLAKAGCALGIVGLAALVLGMLIRLISGHPNAATKILAGGGVVLALLALFGVALYSTLKSAAQTRAVRGRWPDGDEGAAIGAVREIQAMSKPELGMHPKFPRGLLINAVIAAPAGPAGESAARSRAAYAVTKSNLWVRDKRLRGPSWGYVWVDLPQSLPTLVLSSDVPGRSSVTSDVDIESGAFNRRFNVNDKMPGASSTGVDHAQFARYATAILHPRAVEALMSTPHTWMIAIHARKIGAQVSPLFPAADIERLAATLAAVAALVPQFVWDGYAGQSSYSPRR